MKITAAARWPVILEIKSKKPAEVYIDCVPKKINKSITRFLVTCEENYQFINIVIGKQHLFDYILTYWQQILDTLPHAQLYNSATPFVKPNPDIKKKFCVSTVVSGRYKGGSYYRQQLFDRKEEIKIPINFYLSFYLPYEKANYKDNLVLGNSRHFGDKTIVFDCMYHIVINKIKTLNFLDEKIIDCFLTKTIPVFWGTPNISDFFNSKGIIEIKKDENVVDNIIDECNKLTPEYYYDNIDAVNENYEKSLEYKNFDERLSEKIQNILDNEIQ